MTGGKCTGIFGVRRRTSMMVPICAGLSVDRSGIRLLFCPWMTPAREILIRYSDSGFARQKSWPVLLTF